MVRDRYDDIMDALPLAPQQQRARASCRRILRVADDLIEHGQIDRFTTAYVARVADVSIGTLYRYFADRVAILDALRPERHTAAQHLFMLQESVRQHLASAPLLGMQDRELLQQALNRSYGSAR